MEDQEEAQRRLGNLFRVVPKKLTCMVIYLFLGFLVSKNLITGKHSTCKFIDIKKGATEDPSRTKSANNLK